MAEVRSYDRSEDRWLARCWQRDPQIPQSVAYSGWAVIPVKRLFGITHRGAPETGLVAPSCRERGVHEKYIPETQGPRGPSLHHMKACHQCRGRTSGNNQLIVPTGCGSRMHRPPMYGNSSLAEPPPDGPSPTGSSYLAIEWCDTTARTNNGLCWACQRETLGGSWLATSAGQASRSARLLDSPSHHPGRPPTQRESNPTPCPVRRPGPGRCRQASELA